MGLLRSVPFPPHQTKSVTDINYYSPLELHRGQAAPCQRRSLVYRGGRFRLCLSDRRRTRPVRGLSCPIVHRLTLSLGRTHPGVWDAFLPRHLSRTRTPEVAHSPTHLPSPVARELPLTSSTLASVSPMCVASPFTRSMPLLNR